MKNSNKLPIGVVIMLTMMVAGMKEGSVLNPTASAAETKQEESIDQEETSQTEKNNVPTADMTKETQQTPEIKSGQDEKDEKKSELDKPSEKEQLSLTEGSDEEGEEENNKEAQQKQDTQTNPQENEDSKEDTKSNENKESKEDSKEKESSGSTETQGQKRYSVEFIYNGKNFALPEKEEVNLDDILKRLNISGTVTKVSSSNEGLFTAEKADDGWVVTSKIKSGEWSNSLRKGDTQDQETLMVNVDGTEYNITTRDGSAVVISGNCGASSSDQVSYTLYKDGTLFIIASGYNWSDMEDYESKKERRPWQNYVSGNDDPRNIYIKRIIIGYGVKKIGTKAFKDCNHLEYIFIPSTVSEIGDTHEDNTSFSNINDGVHVYTQHSRMGLQNACSGTSVNANFAAPNSSTSKAYFHYNGMPCSDISGFGFPANYGQNNLYAFLTPVEKSCPQNPNQDTWKDYDTDYFHFKNDQLIILGYGTMLDYPDLSRRPWHNAAGENYDSNDVVPAEQIKNIIIKSCEYKPIERIGDNAFKDLSSVTSVDIPTNISQIGQNAFNGLASSADIYYNGKEAELEAKCTKKDDNEQIVAGTIEDSFGGNNAVRSLEDGHYIYHFIQSISYNNPDDPTLGTLPDPETLPHSYQTQSGESIDLPECTNIKEGYEFCGYYEDGKDPEDPENLFYSFNTNTYGDKTLNAKIALKKYTITYNNVNEGENPNNPTFYTFDLDNPDVEVELRPPVRDGGKFLYWYEIPRPEDPEYQKRVDTIRTVLQQDRVLYAKWATEQNVSFNDVPENGKLTKTFGDWPFYTQIQNAIENPTITYSSSDDSVATIDERGMVTIHTAGQATITATIQETDNYLKTIRSYQLTVNKATINNPKVSISGWTYKGSPSTPRSTPATHPDSANEGSISYQYTVRDANEYSDDVPENAGDYTVKAIFSGSPNYYDAEATANFTIAKATISNPKVSISGWTYGGPKNVPEPNPATHPDLANGGKISYKYKARTATEYSDDVPENAGDYTVKAIFSGSPNYYDAEATADFEISKAATGDSDFTQKPKGKNNLIYDGSELELVTEGSVTHGEIVYAVGEGDFSKNVPTATNAGTYTVRYKIDGGNNYEDSDTHEIRVEIARCPTYGTDFDPAPSVIENLKYTGLAQELIEGGSSDCGAVVYTLDQNNPNSFSENIPTATNAGEYSVYYKIIGDQNHKDSQVYVLYPTISRIQPTFTPEVNAPDCTYGMDSAGISVTGCPEEAIITYEYKLKDESDDTSYTSNFPTDAGIYTARIKISGMANYEDIILTEDFEILQATPGLGKVYADEVVDTLDPSAVVFKRQDNTVPGTFTFIDLEGDSLLYGTNTYHWLFTPEDSKNYESVTGDIEVTVRGSYYNANTEDISWQKDSKENLKFTYKHTLISESISEHILEVKVDGDPISENCYYIDADDGLVSLSYKYLATLEDGRHILSLILDTDEIIDTEFTILPISIEPEPESEEPTHNESKHSSPQYSEIATDNKIENISSTAPHEEYKQIINVQEYKSTGDTSNPSFWATLLASSPIAYCISLFSGKKRRKKK